MPIDDAIVKNVPLQEIMTKEVVTILVNEPFSMVYEKLHNHKIRHLPVVNEKGQIVGIITERDLFRAHSPRETESGPVYDKTELDRLLIQHFMTTDPVTLTAKHTVKHALEIFARNQYGCIPIVSTPDNRITGIISHSDILKYFFKFFR